MSLAKFWGVISGIVVVVASAVGWGVAYWFGRMGSLERHAGDDEIHLDRMYHRDHGRPVGKWDLDVNRAETNRRLDEIQLDVKAIHDLQLETTRRRR